MKESVEAMLRRRRNRRLPLVAYRIARRACWYVQGRVRRFRISRRQDPIWLELGAGEKRGKKPWVTIDMNGQCDIYQDLAHGIPFRDAPVSRIYSSHFLEHLTPEEATACLRKCIRVLKTGGEVSAGVPNARIYASAYLSGEQLELDSAVATPGGYMRYLAYCDGQHKNMFDAKSLVELLKTSGLEKASIRDFDPATDLEVRRWETIFAVGYKPPS